AGVCRDCKVLAVKVLNDWGWGYYSWIASGIIYAVQHGADVINMSLGGSGYSWTLRNAVRYAHDAGVTIVASAGNSYCYYYSTVGYPAKFAETIAVAATTSSNYRAYFSSCGPELDISAPGDNIFSTYRYNGYRWWSGTSMAAPHVAGAVGVLLAIKPNLSPEQIRQYLQDTAQYLGSWRYYGAGLLDMPALLKEVAIWGTEGTDYLMGSYQDDVICGLGGDDQIFGFEGDDLLLGGPGQDTIYGNEGNDFIVGGSGYDFIWGGMGEDFCYDKKDSRNDCEYH
ncbi:MAG: S8 family serine peptidase, partial [Pseudomonadota bacterium]|nr:S8 family serine peptidase [Pseudomonadota bacterium]